MRNTLSIISCLVAVLALASTHDARAAFIAPAFNVDGFAEASPGLGGPAYASRPLPSGDDAEQADRGFVPGPRLYSRTGKGMSSHGSSVPTSAGVGSVALPTAALPVSGGRLVTYWSRERRCELPPPSLSRVFRPPRGTATVALFSFPY